MHVPPVASKTFVMAFVPHCLVPSAGYAKLLGRRSQRALRCRVRNRVPLQRRSVRFSPSCCVEAADWRRMPVDIDYAKDEQLEILERDLDVALSTENFRWAAELRDKLLRLQSGSYVEVLTANMKFYSAFDKGSIVDMAGCWLQDASVTCKHPLGPLTRGYLNILESFGHLFMYSFRLRVENVRISMRGTVALVTCEEHADIKDEDEAPSKKTYSDVNSSFTEPSPPVVMLATNVYTKHNGQWYCCHHSSSPVLVQ